MPLYQGPHQIGNCQRCGWKLQRRALTEDGRLRNLLVCAACWDPDHPQDYPAPPRPEGLPDWRPSLVGSVLTPPVLSAVLTGADESTLTWTDADGGGALIVSYSVWRATDGGDFVLLDTLPVERDQYTTQTSNNLYVDDTIGISDHYYTYYIIATNADDESTQSNEDVIYTPIGAVVLSGEWDDPDINLSWTAAVATYPPLGGYSLYRSVDAGAYTLLETFGPAELEHVDDTVDREAHTYDYKVAPFDEEGAEGALSNIVNFPQLDPPPPDNRVLLHFDQEPLIDSSGNGFVVSGDYFFRTSTYKFGPGSIEGTIGAGVDVAGTSGFFDDTSWSVEAWLWVDSANYVAQPLIVMGYTTFEAFPVLGTGFGLIGGNPGFAPVVLKAGWSDGTNRLLASGHNFPTDQWVHVALCWDKDAEVLRMFEDGVVVATFSGPTTFNGQFAPLTLRGIAAGAGSGSSPAAKRIYMDEFRFTQTAAFTGNFTPPASPYA